MYECATLLLRISVPKLTQLLCLSPFHDLHGPNVVSFLSHDTQRPSSAQGPNCRATRLSPYRAENTFLLGYKNELVNAVTNYNYSTMFPFKLHGHPQAVQYIIVQYSTVQYSTLHYITLRYTTLRYCKYSKVHYCTVEYSIVIWVETLRPPSYITPASLSGNPHSPRTLPSLQAFDTQITAS